MLSNRRTAFSHNRFGSNAGNRRLHDRRNDKARRLHMQLLLQMQMQMLNLQQQQSHGLMHRAVRLVRISNIYGAFGFLQQLWRRFAAMAMSLLELVAPKLYSPVACALHVVGLAVETLAFYSSMLLLSGRLLLLRKSLTTNGKLAVAVFTEYFLTPTIALVIESSKMNYRITRLIRLTSRRIVYFMHMLLVLPISFLQICDLLTTLFDTFLGTFTVFIKFIEVVFSYAIFIFKTYKMVATCARSIMGSVYLTSYYSIMLVHNGLACLRVITSLIQHSSLHYALINYKQQRQLTGRRLSTNNSSKKRIF